MPQSKVNERLATHEPIGFNLGIKSWTDWLTVCLCLTLTSPWSACSDQIYSQLIWIDFKVKLNSPLNRKSLEMGRTLCLFLMLKIIIAIIIGRIIIFLSRPTQIRFPYICIFIITLSYPQLLNLAQNRGEDGRYQVLLACVAEKDPEPCKVFAWHVLGDDRLACCVSICISSVC